MAVGRFSRGITGEIRAGLSCGGLGRLLGFFCALGVVRVAAALAAIGAFAASGALGALSSGARFGNNRTRGEHFDKLAHRGRKLASALVDDRHWTEESSLLE